MHNSYFALLSSLVKSYALLSSHHSRCRHHHLPFSLCFSLHACRLLHHRLPTKLHTLLSFRHAITFPIFCLWRHIRSVSPILQPSLCYLRPMETNALLFFSIIQRLVAVFCLNPIPGLPNSFLLAFTPPRGTRPFLCAHSILLTSTP